MHIDRKLLNYYDHHTICQADIPSASLFWSQNMSINTKAALEITMDKYPHITAIGCASHGLNLLLSDFMKLDTLQRTCRAKEVIKHDVLDDVSWVHNSLQILTSIFSAICASESDTALLSRIPNHMAMIKHAFKNLSASSLTTNEKSKVKDFIKKLGKKCVAIQYMLLQI
ncbi:hypothetical protein E2320_015437 [Naja naja]|nr:hypothetical protein E2320_015437 [Naja naja]